jgi:hypothetical protein
MQVRAAKAASVSQKQAGLILFCHFMQEPRQEQLWLLSVAFSRNQMQLIAVKTFLCDASWFSKICSNLAYIKGK